MVFNIDNYVISPYAICFISSFIAEIIYILVRFKKEKLPIVMGIYSLLLTTALILYGAFIFTIVTQLIENGAIENIGFSSLGGLLGAMAGVFIFTRIYKDHTAFIVNTYMVSMGLMYGISKLGCYFAGCCHGIAYKGLGYVAYSKAGVLSEKYFPIQLVESVTFLILFLIISLSDRRRKSGITAISILAYGFAKFALDYLRYYPDREIFSINQIVCLAILLICIVFVTRRRFSRK